MLDIRLKVECRTLLCEKTLHIVRSLDPFLIDSSRDRCQERQKTRADQIWVNSVTHLLTSALYERVPDGCLMALRSNACVRPPHVCTSNRNDTLYIGTVVSNLTVIIHLNI